jgi:spore germination cell wall hydrolase CwlJ-like protein
MQTKWLYVAFLCAFWTCQAAETWKIDLVAAVLAAEARSEGAQGMAAVAQVISNRGGDPAATVSRRWQFSCLNRGSPAALVSEMRQKHGKSDKAAWLEARRLAAELYQPDNRAICKAVGRATHYRDVSIKPPKGWGPCLAKVGRLRFYYVH